MIMEDRRIGIRPLLRVAVTAVAFCLCLSTARADRAGTVPGHSLWNAAMGAVPHANGSGPADTETSVILGRGSSGARELATRVLAERYPCSAIALTLFDPPALGQGSWATRFYGAPTTRTAHLIAEGAREERIAESIVALSSVPFDSKRAMHVTITLSSRPLGAGIAVSTIRCEGLDALTGIALQRLEPVIDFTWMTRSAQLLSISRED